MGSQSTHRWGNSPASSRTIPYISREQVSADLPLLPTLLYRGNVFRACMARNILHSARGVCTCILDGY
jgi:hypothetical protein